MYEPEQFPGLIYRMDEPKVVILIFSSGKLVCTGAKKEEEVYRAVTILQKTLEEKELIRYEQERASLVQNWLEMAFNSCFPRLRLWVRLTRLSWRL